MYSKLLKMSAAAACAAAAALLALAPPADRTAAQEPSLAPDGHSERADDGYSERAEAALGDLAAVPVASMDTRQTLSRDSLWLLTVRFSEAVTGLAQDDFSISNATITRMAGGGAAWELDLKPTAEFAGEVVVTLRASAVTSTSTREPNVQTVHRFTVDRRSPRFASAIVAQRVVAITFDEMLASGRIPATSAFSVMVGSASRGVTRVQVEAARALVTLASAVRSTDTVRVSYTPPTNAAALEDARGNPAQAFSNQLARNTTDVGAGAPGPPLNLRAVADGISAIDLSWTAPSDTGNAAVTGYRIEHSGNGSVWRTLVANTGNTRTTWEDGGLGAGTTRYYRVSAINSFGTGRASNAAVATTGTRVPPAPTGLTARARGTSEIALSWTAPSAGAAGATTGYRIEVSTTGIGAWRILVDNTGSTATSYTHTGLSAGSTRFYRVRGINRAGRGDASNVASATTNLDVPGVPTGLSAVPGGEGGRDRIVLTWRRPADDGGVEITGYRVEVSPNGVTNWTVLVTNTGSAAQSYTHSGLAPGTTRHYRVAAINSQGTGRYSDAASATTNLGAPGPPQRLRASADGARSITLTWTPPDFDGGAPIIGYRIDAKRPSAANWRTLSSNTGSTETTFRHGNLQPVTTWEYRVLAVNSVGAGDPSHVATASTPADVPSAPLGLTARTRGTSRIDLSWRAPASDGGAAVTGYRIESSPDGNQWTVVRSNTGTTATTFSHVNLAPGTMRHYRVSAVNRAGAGEPSNVARGMTDAILPTAPRSLRARTNGTSQIDLSWLEPTSDGGADITGYRIEASQDGNRWTVLRTSTRSAATTFSHSGLPPGSTRYYRVSAVNRAGTGPASNVAQGETDATTPNAPRSLRAQANGTSRIDLSWREPTSDGGAEITGYRIEVSQDGGGSWSILEANTRTDRTSHSHTGLAPASTRHYRVSAVNRVGHGRASDVAVATTNAAVPDPPRGLTARARGTSQIDLSWRAPASDGGAAVTGYRVEASPDGNEWSVVRSSAPPEATTFSHVGLAPGTTRYYRVSAINRAGAGKPSNVARGTTDATAPNAPRSLRAQANGTSRIDLSWREPTTDGGAPITGYRIEVSRDGGVSWHLLEASTGNDATSYSHTGLAPASTRHYRVSAVNRVGHGRASGVAAATTDATVPDAPTGLTARAVAPDQIDLAWTAPAYDGGARITGYRVEVSETGAAWSVLVADSRSTGTSYSHTGLVPGSRRFYRVSAINSAGAGKPSDPASAATDDPVQRAGRLNTMVLPHVAAAMTSSTVSAIADRIGAVAAGRGAERSMEMGSLSGMAAELDGAGGAGAGPSRAGAFGWGRLLAGSSWQTPLGRSGGAAQAAGLSALSAWGGGEYQSLGRPGAADVDWQGGLTSFHLGADVRVVPEVLVGLAATRSSGSFDFTDRTGAEPVTGTYGTTMTSVNPYAAWISQGGATVAWATGGMGWGDVEVEDAKQALRGSPASMITGAAGASRKLFSSGIGGVSLRAEGWAGRVNVDGAAEVEAATLNLQRGRLLLEWGQAYRSAGGDEIAISIESGMRYDNGDGANGGGIEVGGGLRYVNAGIGLVATGRGRVLVAGLEGYREWGAGGMIQFDPGRRGQGLSIRLAPSYGESASGMAQLWERGVSEAAPGGFAGGSPARMNGEVSYGAAGRAGTPFASFQLAGGGHRAFGSGLRYDLGSGLGVRIEAARHETGGGGPRHSLGVRGRLALR